MAPYGIPGSPEVAAFRRKIEEHIVSVKADGSIHLNQEYFSYSTGLRMIRERKWAALFGFPLRPPESDMEQHHCDLALAIQEVTEEIVLRMARTARKLTGCTRLCLAGGVALNCVANGRLLRSGIFADIWIQPAAGDAGGALGAAYAAHHMYYDQPRLPGEAADAMQGSYLGPEYSELDTVLMLKKFNARGRSYESFDRLCEDVAGHIADGQVVGWHQGRMEWGPRSLGNRSILGDPRNEDMQKKLNLKIKYRESFRPFAPSVLAEDCQEYFDLGSPSPYMLLVADVQKAQQNPLPADYYEQDLKKRLYFLRSGIPSVTHLDYSARVQTVHGDTNPRYHRLIRAFRDRTGCSLLVNTSFNVRGEPIVCTPEDSYRCFMRTEMDYLVIGNQVFAKTDQPDWDAKDRWQEEFKLD